jgi:hypothetical protein
LHFNECRYIHNFVDIQVLAARLKRQDKMNIYIIKKSKFTVFAVFTLTFFMGCAQNTIPEIVKNKTQNIKFDLSHNFIEVKAIMQDTIQGNFAIDNGMGYTNVDSAFFYSRFDTTKFTFKKELLEGMGIKEYEGPLSIKIGDYSYTITHFIVQNCKNLGPQNINGIIGEELFLKKIVAIDFDRQMITFPDSICVDSTYHRFALLPPYGEIKFAPNAKFGKMIGFGKRSGKKVSGHLQFDLGCIGTDLLVKHTFIAKFKATEKLGGRALINTIQKSYTKSWLIDSMRIGNICLNNITATTTYVDYKNEPKGDPLVLFKEGDGYVGLNLLKRFNIISDYQNNTLYLKPNGNFNKNMNE